MQIEGVVRVAAVVVVFVIVGVFEIIVSVVRFVKMDSRLGLGFGIGLECFFGVENVGRFRDGHSPAFAEINNPVWG